MSILGNIASFATGTYTLVRTAVGSHVRGRYASGASTLAQTITACIQPLSGRDLKVLAEGQRADETRVIYTETELRTRHPSDNPDRVVIDGEAWEVFRVERWEGFGTTHYRALVSRLTPTTAIAESGASLRSATLAGTGTVA